MKKRNIPIETWLSAILAAMIFLPVMETTVTMGFMGQVSSSSTTVTLYDYMTSIFKNAVSTDNDSFNDFINSNGAALVVCWLLLNAVLQALRKHISIITIIISFALALFCFGGIHANGNEADGNMFAAVTMQHKPQIGLFFNFAVSIILFICSLITMFVSLWKGSRWLYYKIRGIEPPKKAIVAEVAKEETPLVIEENKERGDEENKKESNEESKEENKEESNVPSEINTSVETAPNQGEATESSNGKKWIYAIGGIIAAAIICIICFFAFGKSKQSESILGLQQPKWEKFVHMRGKETAFFKSPDTSSPRLMQASNDEGCEIFYQYLWSGEKPREGLTDLENYKYSDETSVFPVIEEYENWYKVHINDGEKLCEAYVEKAQCEEVKPEPITQEILTQISTDYHLQKEGKYANICFKLGSTESGGHLCMGELIDEKCLAFSPAYEMNIIESDTTQNTTFDRGSFTFDDGTKEYFFTLYYNPSRAVTLNDYKTFDTKKITEAEIGKFISTMKEVKPKDMKISYEYYFPAVSTSNLFCFNIHNEVQETTNTESSGEKHVTEYKADDQNLMALVDGEWIETGITSMLRFEVYQQQDLDDDGNTEIILKNFDGGNDVYYPFVIYYDKATNSFKESKPMESEEEPTIETGESGATLIVQNEGLRTIKYKFAEGTLKLVSDKMKDVGKIRRTLAIKDVYPDDGNGERNMTFDFDGDGEEENVTFYRGTTHAEGYGKYMDIKMIKWSDGRVAGSEDGSLIFAGTFRFLTSETNGMPDIIADSYLKKWNGSSYE